jgi:hypothetical protein
MTLLFHISHWFLQITFLIVAVIFLLRPILIKIFDRFGYLRYVALVILAALLWLRPFVSPCYAVHSGADAPLHQWLCQFLPPGEPLAAALGFILLMAQAFYLNSILIRIKVIPKKSLLPAALYILLMSQSISGLTLNPVLCGAAFVIPAIDLIFKSRVGKNLFNYVFLSGILLAIATLFCFEFIFLFPLLFVSFLIFQNSSGLRAGFFAIAGFVTIFLLLFLYYLIAEDPGEQMGVYVNRFLYPPLFWQELELTQYILIGWQMYIYYMAISTIIANREKLNDYTRKIMFFSISFVLLSLVSIFYMMDDLEMALMLPAIPSTIFMGAYISLTTKKVMMSMVEMFLLTSCLVLFFYNLYWAVC